MNWNCQETAIVVLVLLSYIFGYAIRYIQDFKELKELKELKGEVSK